MSHHLPLLGVIVVLSEELVSEAVTPRHVALATEMVVQTPHTPPHHPTNPLLLTPLTRHRGNVHSYLISTSYDTVLDNTVTV